jgi:hypothetical protein
MSQARLFLIRSAVHKVSSPDLFLDLIPVMGLENVLAWGIPLFLGLVACLFFLYPERIPFSLKTVGLLFLIRSFFVVLTPLGMRADQVVQAPQGFLQDLAYSSYDFFFSGHVAVPFLFALIFWRNPWVRSLMLCIALFVAAAVLLAHTHYSIDVFSVPFIVPTIYRIAQHFFRDDITSAAPTSIAR